MKAYLAHPISTTGEKKDSIRVAKRLREELGLTVYAAAENKSINDKSNNPEPRQIYQADIPEIRDCDILIANVTGGLQDGTIGEIKYVAGLNDKEMEYREHLKEHGIEPFGKIIPIIAYTSNERLLQPQFYKGIASAGANHLILGAIDEWGMFTGSEDSMIEELKGILERYSQEIN